MPRTARVELAGGIQHVTARGNRKQAIFADEADRRSFLRELRLVHECHGCRCLSYCLMTNHVHLVIETERETLGVGMRDLLGRHAARMNRRWESSGHLFQDRFWSRLVQSDEHFAQLLRYVALNPVAAQLCSDPSEWPWSSHRALLAGRSPRIEGLLGAWGGREGTRYASLFVEAHPVARKYGTGSPWDYRPPLAVLLGNGDLDAGMQTARDCGYRVTEIAHAAGVSKATVSRRTRPPQ